MREQPKTRGFDTGSRTPRATLKQLTNRCGDAGNANTEAKGQASRSRKQTTLSRRGERSCFSRTALARAILSAVFFLFPSAAVLSAQVAAFQEQPFSKYQSDLEATADALLATPGRQAFTNHPTDPVPFVPADSYVASPDVDIVREFARRYWNGRYDDLLRAIQRVRALRGSIEPILESEGLPPDLIGIVLVESAGNSFALSPRGAYGLWQLMPETARRYGLVVSPRLDERTETIKATRAAAQYLKDLYARFGSWPLAMAAYNAGEAAVQTVIGRQEIGAVWNSSSQGLPAETQNYVPAVIAARRLFAFHAPVSVLTAVTSTESAGLLLDSRLQVAYPNTNENALNQAKYVKIGEHEQGRVN